MWRWHLANNCGSVHASPAKTGQNHPSVLYCDWLIRPAPAPAGHGHCCGGRMTDRTFNRQPEYDAIRNFSIHNTTRVSFSLLYTFLTPYLNSQLLFFSLGASQIVLNSASIIILIGVIAPAAHIARAPSRD